MKLIDMHCDTLMKLLDQPEKSLAELDAEVNLPCGAQPVYYYIISIE